MKRLLAISGFVIYLVCNSWSANLLSQADLLAQTRTILGEPTASVSNWTDAQLNRYVQDACNLLVNAQIVTIEQFDTIPRSSGTYLYSLNTNFLQVATVWRKAGDEITPCQQVRPDSFFAINIRYGDTLKIYYTIFGNDSLASATPRIAFRPTPEETDTVFVWYYAKPKFLTGTDTLTNIQQPYRSLIPYLAASLAWRGANRPDLADNALQSLAPFISRLPEKKTEILQR